MPRNVLRSIYDQLDIDHITERALIGLQTHARLALYTQHTPNREKKHLLHLFCLGPSKN